MYQTVVLEVPLPNSVCAVSYASILKANVLRLCVRVCLCVHGTVLINLICEWTLTAIYIYQTNKNINLTLYSCLMHCYHYQIFEFWVKVAFFSCTETFNNHPTSYSICLVPNFINHHVDRLEGLYLRYCFHDMSTFTRHYLILRFGLFVAPCPIW